MCRRAGPHLHFAPPRRSPWPCQTATSAHPATRAAHSGVSAPSFVRWCLLLMRRVLVCRCCCACPALSLRPGWLPPAGPAGSLWPVWPPALASNDTQPLRPHQLTRHPPTRSLRGSVAQAKVRLCVALVSFAVCGASRVPGSPLARLQARWARFRAVQPLPEGRARPHSRHTPPHPLPTLAPAPPVCCTGCCALLMRRVCWCQCCCCACPALSLRLPAGAAWLPDRQGSRSLDRQHPIDLPNPVPQPPAAALSRGSPTCTPTDDIVVQHAKV